MSLLEDVFLEDEAGEAQELERIIEGDEVDERPRSVASSNSDNDSEKEDEATEDKRRVDPTKAKTTRVVKNPRVILNPARLTGPRGIQVIPDHFKDFKFKGKGHEKEDLDLVLKKLEHWAYRLFPKFEFGDCLKKIEMLGKKRPVMVHLHKIRSGQYTTEETVVQRDSSDEEPPAQGQPPEEDEFDKLLQQQIELARATPAPGSVTKRGFETPSTDKKSPFTMLKATASPSISDEQRDRMIRNRQLAEERRLARLKQNTNTNANSPTVDLTNLDANNSNDDNDVEVNAVKKHKRSNIIDSSDDEDSHVVSKIVTVDIQMHETAVKDVTEVNNESSSTTVIEIQEDNGNEKVTKQNKSNVIDNSDDEESNTVNKLVTVDIQMHETAVEDVTEVNNELSSATIIGKQQVYGNKRVKKQNKINVIHSSYNEDSITVDQPVPIDVHMQDTVAKKVIEVNNELADSNIIEVNGESTKDKNVTIDLTEVIPIKCSSVFKEGQVIDIVDENSSDIGIRKHNKSNVADSSDVECEMTSFDHSVMLDVHSEIKESTENIEKSKNENSNNKDNGTESIDEDFEEIEEDNQIDYVEVTTKLITESVKVGEHNENNASEMITNVKDANNQNSDISQDNKENVNGNAQNESNDPVEELMDVDFSDDF